MTSHCCPSVTVQKDGQVEEAKYQARKGEAGFANELDEKIKTKHEPKMSQKFSVIELVKRWH